MRNGGAGTRKLAEVASVALGRVAGDTMQAMRFFNTEGPVRAADHYCIPPLTRIDLDEVLALVRGQKYFVLHAPRQTGKTSALLALRDLLNAGAAGDYRCAYANFEVGQAAREDTARAMRAMLGEIARRARLTLGDEDAGPTAGGRAGERGCGWRADRRALPVGRGRPASAGAAHRRDRHAGRRHAAVSAAPVAGGLRPAAAELPAQRRPVRRAGRAGLPHSVRGAETRWCSAAARSTSSRSRCGWATSAGRRRGRCWNSTPPRPDRHSRWRRWRRSARARRGSRGS